MLRSSRVGPLTLIADRIPFPVSPILPPALAGLAIANGCIYLVAALGAFGESPAVGLLLSLAALAHIFGGALVLRRPSWAVASLLVVLSASLLLLFLVSRIT